MGNGYKKKRNKARNEQKSSNQKPRPEIGTVSNNYIQDVIDRGNFRFECYYAVQGIHNQRFEGTESTNTALVACMSDEERERERLLWRQYLGKILPASFRLGKDIPEYYKQTLTKELDDLLQKAQEYDVDDSNDANDNLLRDPRAGPLKESATEIQTLSFCPYAYQLSGLDRATIRKNPALEQLHLWLKQQVAAGTITRQETVSMIPTTLLNVVSTDVVLDMCAAPGSKTSQILEDLQCNIVDSPIDTTSPLNATSTPATLGCLVANDASVPRACMLVSQLRRILHMHPVALITAVNAQFFPSDVIQFDKILCDVPCSGDGTTRKNINVWKTWSASGALALHSLQLSIAMKGAAQLLKTNGTMVYSTCSLNPIENEAVVAELLRQSNGALELIEYIHDKDSVIDATSRERFTNGPLPGFHTRPGMSSWKVLCEDMTQRQQKNKEKKNNAKMKKKREEYEATQATVSDPSVTPTIPDIQNNDESTCDAKQPLHETQPDRSAARRFEPTAWDEKTLLQLAESEGLRQYLSMADVPPNLNRRIRKSAFPPSEDEVEKFHLERCIRCLPQDNNTGGFFVALLRKVSSWSANDRRQERKSSATTDTDVVQTDSPVVRHVKRQRSDKADDENNDFEDENDEVEQDFDTEENDVEDVALLGLDAENMPLIGNTRNSNKQGHPGEDFGKDDFAAVRDNIMDPLIDHYGLCNGFDKTLYMARACSESKVIYYVGKPVKQLFDLGIQKRLTIVNTGLKGFMRNNRNVADCAVTYRVCQEGVHFLVPYMTKRKYVVGRHDFRTCLLGRGETIHLSKFSDDFRNNVSSLSPGSFVVILDGYEDKLEQKFLVCMWKCRGESIDSLVAKVEVDDLLNKLDSMDLK